MLTDIPSSDFVDRWKEWIFGIQQVIVEGLQQYDEVEFVQNKWKRHDGNGDGIACILENGTTFEKAGVNTTQLQIPLSKGIYKTMSDQNHLKTISENEVDEYEMFACGVSLVIHPHNPHVPTVHANYRVLMVLRKEDQEIEDWWFGGGSDLTPIYLHTADAIHFHTVLKAACDKYDEEFYPKFKQKADDYFYIKCRKEHRGVGGIFYENLNDRSFEELFGFAKS